MMKFLMKIMIQMKQKKEEINLKKIMRVSHIKKLNLIFQNLKESKIQNKIMVKGLI